MGKSRKQTVTQSIDPRSQTYVDAMRLQGQAGADAALKSGPFFTGPLSAQDIQGAMDPYMGSVVDATRGEFERLRAQASTGVNQEATAAGAFGGSRHALAAGARLGELDRAQTQQVAGLMSQGYSQAVQLAEMQRQQREQQMQEPLFRHQAAQQMINLGLGPTGMKGTSVTPGNLLGDLAGIAMVGGGLLMGGPAGAAAGAQAAGGLFGGGGGGGAPGGGLPAGWRVPIAWPGGGR